jgi:muconolactone delta-isomerase
VEYLVTMTTHVPDGTSQEVVDDVRLRESVRAGELAAQGRLLRLWRPPLLPGEWRTLGLFAADAVGELEDALASMPLHVWRTDEIAPLSPHPNDPAATTSTGVETEFLVGFLITVPDGTLTDEVEDRQAREAERVRELAKDGRVLRLWRPPAKPGEWRGLGLWRATDAEELEDALESLPLYEWFTTEITPLAPHPNDPAVGKS